MWQWLVCKCVKYWYKLRYNWEICIAYWRRLLLIVGSADQNWDDCGPTLWTLAVFSSPSRLIIKPGETLVFNVLLFVMKVCRLQFLNCRIEVAEIWRYRYENWTSSLRNYRLLQVNNVRKYLGRFDQNILLEISPADISISFCLVLDVVYAHFVMYYTTVPGLSHGSLSFQNKTQLANWTIFLYSSHSQAGGLNRAWTGWAVRITSDSDKVAAKINKTKNCFLNSLIDSYITNGILRP